MDSVKDYQKEALHSPEKEKWTSSAAGEVMSFIS
jgi:hypothetical protein